MTTYRRSANKTLKENKMKINEINLLTNKEFSVKIKTFQSNCEKANVEPTKRQASKWRNKKGLAFQAKGVQANA